MGLNSNHLLQQLLTMYVLLLANLLLFVQAEPPQDTDEKCFNDNYKNKMVEPAPDNNELLLVYNSSHVCGGMNEKKITITNTTYSVVNEKCNFHCMEANEDAPDMKFPYYDWVIALPNHNNFTMKDTLTVKAGVGASISSVWLVCCLALLAKYI